jgi:hypothetical protein
MGPSLTAVLSRAAARPRAHGPGPRNQGEKLGRTRCPMLAAAERRAGREACRVKMEMPDANASLEVWHERTRDHVSCRSADGCTPPNFFSLSFGLPAQAPGAACRRTDRPAACWKEARRHVVSAWGHGAADCCAEDRRGSRCAFAPVATGENGDDEPTMGRTCSVLAALPTS